MIDLSHDNSGKEPGRQPWSPPSGRQVADGGRRDRRRDARVVPRRGPPGARHAVELTYGQSITDGCIDWDTTVEVLDGLAGAVSAAAARSRGPPSADADRGHRRRADRRLDRARGPGAARGRPSSASTRPRRRSRRRWSAAPSTGPRPAVADAVAGAEAVFVAVPVGALPRAVGAALAAAPADCVVTDVGSTKRTIVAAHADPRFVGGHPLAGAENAGVEHARADLFDGATWYLTPTASTSGLLYERLHRLLHGLGAQPAAIEPDTHDTIWPPSRTSRTCSPTCSSPRPPGAGGGRASGCPRPARASATRPGWPAPRARSGPTSICPTATR